MTRPGNRRWMRWAPRVPIHNRSRDDSGQIGQCRQMELSSVIRNNLATQLGYVKRLAKNATRDQACRHQSGVWGAFSGAVMANFADGALVNTGRHVRDHAPPHCPRPRPDRMQRAVRMKAGPARKGPVGLL